MRYEDEMEPQQELEEFFATIRQTLEGLLAAWLPKDRREAIERYHQLLDVVISHDIVHRVAFRLADAAESDPDAAAARDGYVRGCEAADRARDLVTEAIKVATGDDEEYLRNRENSIREVEDLLAIVQTKARESLRNGEDLDEIQEQALRDWQDLLGAVAESEAAKRNPQYDELKARLEVIQTEFSASMKTFFNYAAENDFISEEELAELDGKVMQIMGVPQDLLDD